MSTPRSAAEIRRSFLDFFEKHGHRIVESAPVLNRDDPTLMFTNAGMNQFKDIFLGTAVRDYVRAANSQKCLRVSGKHNDLEEVGRDGFHHTFFEMLGNWSFGDYFKKEAISMGWELLTKVWQIDKARLYATVLEGDDESERLWKEVTDIDSRRLSRGGKKDNFWEMGDVGPCGPCSEIHVDNGPEECTCPQGKCLGINSGCPRFIELWNLVFIQFNCESDGTLTPLPKKHVDTGMGLERAVRILQNKKSNYDTDLFRPVFTGLGEICGLSSPQGEILVAFRVIADHMRALCSTIADGALPGNSGEGYVLRRLLRRAARFGRQTLEMKEPFLYRLVPRVVEILGGAYREIAQREEHITLLIRDEEEKFEKTLDQGLELFAGLAEETLRAGRDRIDGEKAYRLFSTYGFPKDLIELMSKEKELSVDQGGWEEAQKKHQAISRGELKGFIVDPAPIEGLPPVKFLGYGEDFSTRGGTLTEAQVVAVPREGVIVLDRTVFYAAAGGQVGDTGTIEGKEGEFLFRVKDTQKVGTIILHEGQLERGIVRPGMRVTARVDEERRLSIAANHTATHLLHYALGELLGTKELQQGSLVAENYLRFDFSCPRPLTKEEIAWIEDRVNEKILAGGRVRSVEKPLEEARKMGAVAIFGEKYGDTVRVVDTGGYSRELCGGTHLSSTSQVGSFAILSEESVQAGVRRIVAVTRKQALELSKRARSLMEQVRGLLNVPEEKAPERISSLLQRIKDLEKDQERRTLLDLRALAEEILRRGERIGGGILVLAENKLLNAKDLGSVADILREGGKPVCGLLAGTAGRGVSLVAFSSSSLSKEKGIDCGQIMRKVAPCVGGGGGGSKTFATAGGKDPKGAESALAKARELFSKSLLAHPLS